MPQGHRTSMGRIKITKLVAWWHQDSRVSICFLSSLGGRRQEAGDIHPFSKPDFLHLVTAGPLHCLVNPTVPPAWPRDRFSSGTQPSHGKGTAV